MFAIEFLSSLTGDLQFEMWVVREGLCEKLAFEQGLEGGEGISPAETGEELPRKGGDQMQAPDGGSAQHWEVRVAGPEQQCDQLCRPLSTKPEFTLK